MLQISSQVKPRSTQNCYVTLWCCYQTQKHTKLLRHVMVLLPNPEAHRTATSRYGVATKPRSTRNYIRCLTLCCYRTRSIQNCYVTLWCCYQTKKHTELLRLVMALLPNPEAHGTAISRYGVVTKPRSTRNYIRSLTLWCCYQTKKHTELHQVPHTVVLPNQEAHGTTSDASHCGVVTKPRSTELHQVPHTVVLLQPDTTKYPILCCCCLILSAVATTDVSCDSR
jgi:hypothetical protein